MPVPDEWRAIEAPVDRLRHGLTEMVAWYRANEQMLGNVLFDVDPDAPPPSTPDPFEVRMGAMLDALMEGWQVVPYRRALTPGSRRPRPRLHDVAIVAKSWRLAG